MKNTCDASAAASARARNAPPSSSDSFAALAFAQSFAEGVAARAEEARQNALAEVEELEALEELGDRMPCGGLVDVRQAIETAQRGRVLDLQELSGVAALIKKRVCIQKQTAAERGAAEPSYLKTAL